MKTKVCPHCRGGKVYQPGEMLPSDCTSCNGTGIDGNPVWVGMAFVASAVAVAWILWRIFEGVRNHVFI